MKKYLNLQHLMFAIAVVSLVHAGDLHAQNAKAPWKQVGKVSTEMPREFENVGIFEKSGDQIDPNIVFTNEAGEVVTLGSYFNKGKPLIISMVYFNCPSLCNLHLNGLTDGLREMDWTIGDKFEVLSVTIDPTETADLAAGKKESYIEAYGRPEAAQGWHFLTGEESQIKKLSEQLGFGYKWDEATKQYAHAAAAIILTPEGKVSRYLHGVAFDSKTVRLSLVEASNGKIGGIIDSFVLFCFQYDPDRRTYAFYAFNIMKYGAALCALAFFAFLFPNWRRMIKESKK